MEKTIKNTLESENCYFCQGEGPYFEWKDGKMYSVCLKHMSADLSS